uniref:thioredoxin-dependent peroxiredoxin n=1 Tax=Ditylenchus dipsaci TaxID=166011 RepID=A0A915ENF1_9BILA
MSENIDTKLRNFHFFTSDEEENDEECEGSPTQVPVRQPRIIIEPEEDLEGKRYCVVCSIGQVKIIETETRQREKRWQCMNEKCKEITFVCSTEIIAFSERYNEFKNLNTILLAASTDSKYSHLEWIRKPRNHGGLRDLEMPLLVDTNHRISRDYGVPKDDEGIAYRGLFIIDPKGVLRQITINDLPVVHSVDETVRLIKAFQYYDNHGVARPANGTPSKDTIQPDPKNRQTSFSRRK